MSLKKKSTQKIRSDQVEKLKNTLQSKKVAVFIDAANLYYASSKANMKMSFESIYSWFQKNSQSVKLYFYTAYNPEGKDQIEFLQMLESIGYCVVKKPIKIFESLTKGNMDIELAVDALSKSSSYDAAILMSGDGDFSYLLQHLKEIGKITIIIGVGGYTSHELHEIADQYYFLDRLGKVWQNKLKFNMQNYRIFLDSITETDYQEPQIIPDSEATQSISTPLVKLEKLKLKLASKPHSKH